MESLRDDELTLLAGRYLAGFCGHSLESLLTPIAGAEPAGPSLRGDPLLAEIREARREDDASLPQGAWRFEPKRADWSRAAALAAEAIARASKDLQLAAWLLEAEIHLRGFHALAPCFVLMDALCERYWAGLHPLPQDGDPEFRGNLFRWLDDKLPPLLRRVEITRAGREREFAWEDWQRSGGREDAEGGGQFLAALRATPDQDAQLARSALNAALAGLERLQGRLNQLLGEDAPGLFHLRSLLRDIRDLMERELEQRGRGFAEYLPAEPAPAAESPDPGPLAAEAAMSREQAYALLARAAECLLRLEPHSPAPYLVRRAVEWGRMNTVELYQELFVRRDGRISIFELLGLQEETRG